jgi:ubiquinone/menaquinone biosynthesis C-methylase UbiE
MPEPALAQNDFVIHHCSLHTQPQGGEPMPEASTYERFKRAVEDEWRNPQVTAAYRKWDRDESEWGRAARELIIDRASLRPGLRVLDIGSAHGEPGIAIASAVGPSGRVTLLDLAPELLEIAAERARRDGLANIDTQVADAHDLPFGDESFDRVTSRLAAMYFADYHRAFQEALRVLRRGGRSTYLVWGPFEQPMFRDIVGVLFKYVAPPEDEPGAPSPFRFSEPGTLARAMSEAGFANVREESASVPTTFPGDPARWWEWFIDMAPPVQTWLAGMDDGQREAALAEIHAALRRFDDGRVISVPIDVHVCSGEKAL